MELCKTFSLTVAEGNNEGSDKTFSVGFWVVIPSG